MLVLVVLCVGLGGVILGFAGGFIIGLAKAAAKAIFSRVSMVVQAHRFARGGTP